MFVASSDEILRDILLAKASALAMNFLSSSELIFGTVVPVGSEPLDVVVKAVNLKYLVYLDLYIT